MQTKQLALSFLLIDLNNLISWHHISSSHPMNPVSMNKKLPFLSASFSSDFRDESRSNQNPRITKDMKLKLNNSAWSAN